MKVSGYTTTYNCIEMEYPYLECLEALRGFCDEVCVADAGSSDGTVESIRREMPGVRLESFPVDFTARRWAIELDGRLKTKARGLCSGDVLWHSDVDEILNPDDQGRARDICRRALERRQLIALPAMDFWGDLDTLRSDVPYRPCVSPNFKGTVHGIPAGHRETDAEGHVYPRPFVSDSCGYVVDGSWAPIPSHAYDDGPRIWHVSWLDLERKVRHYRRLWQAFNRSLYNLPEEDTAELNVMFDKPWSEVTDHDIAEAARTLKERGPSLFHRKPIMWRGWTRPREAHERVPESIRRWHARSR